MTGNPTSKNKKALVSCCVYGGAVNRCKLLGIDPMRIETESYCRINGRTDYRYVVYANEGE